MRHMRISSWQRQGRTSAGLAVAVLMVLSACSGAADDAQTSHSSPAKRTNLVVGARAFLYALPAAGGIPRPVLGRNTGASPQNVSGPTWSPDGRWIAFAGGCLGCRAKLYVVSADGRRLREVPTGPGAVSSPSWSPNGHDIVFAREQSEDQRIYSVNLPSGRVRLVHGEPEGLDNTDLTPSWSPDGRHIAFAREIHHERQNLWVIPAAGGTVRPLTRASQFGQYYPRWSPDGRKIVFMQTVPPYITWDLHILRVRTGAVTDLTRDPHNEFDPAWSPDGKMIVFASDAASHAGFRSLYVIAAGGSGLHRLTSGVADDSMPSWSPDGRTIVFVRRPIARA
jgi:TolB protein